jgi:phosphoribosyl 1,2-cyclic phosphate phosphodiesterase
MRVTLLGTGGSAGVPMIGGADGAGEWGECDLKQPRNRRTRASILLEHGPHRKPIGTLLVDTSPDMRTQMLACAVRRVDAILITHSHADHISGLDDVRMLNRVVDRPIDLFATQSTLDELNQRFDYAFRPWQPPGFFRPVLVPHAVCPGDGLSTAGMQIRVFDQDHGFTRTLGLRVGDFGYSTDAVELDETALKALNGVDTWVVGCFQRFGRHHTHAWLDRVYEWVDRVRPRRTVLTHMGVDMDWGWLRANLPPAIEPGYDGQVIELAEGDSPHD